VSEVVALFSTRDEAERAADELLARGYDAERIGYVDRYRDETGEIVSDEDYFGNEDYEQSEVVEETTKGVAGGAIGGAAVGAGAGLLASAGLLLVPGIGPFLAAGTLASTLGAAGVGAAGGGVLGGAAGAIFGAVEDDEPDDETAGFYREGVSQGRALLSVDVDDGDAMEVASLLRASGAERTDVYGDEGWSEWDRLP
jgi:hypothetical protein